VPFEPYVDPPDPVLPVPADPAGVSGPTKIQAARSGWRRVGPRAYVPSYVDPTVVTQRIAESSPYLGGGAFTAWAGLHLAGAAYFDGQLRDTVLPVPVCLGQVPGRRTPHGVALSYEPLGEGIVLHGLPCHLPSRSLFDEIRRLDDWREGVVAFDMTAAAGLTSQRRLADFAAAHSGFRRAARLEVVLRHVSEHARSPQETRLRLIWVDVGFPPPHVNRELRTPDGRFICVPDIFDEQAGLVVEYDGADHRKGARHASDAGRYERAREAGLEYCTVTGPDMHRPREVEHRLRAARSRAPFTPVGARRWVLAPRSGMTLDERLDVREAMARDVRARHGWIVRPW
jgi:hypothetical protein